MILSWIKNNGRCFIKRKKKRKKTKKADRPQDFSHVRPRSRKTHTTSVSRPSPVAIFEFVKLHVVSGTGLRSYAVMTCGIHNRSRRNVRARLDFFGFSRFVSTRNHVTTSVIISDATFRNTIKVRFSINEITVRFPVSEMIFSSTATLRVNVFSVSTLFVFQHFFWI